MYIVLADILIACCYPFFYFLFFWILILTLIGHQIPSGEIESDGFIVMRSILLRSLALIYLHYFISIYPQLDALWGDYGIMPVKFELHYLERAGFINLPCNVF